MRLFANTHTWFYAVLATACLLQGAFLTSARASEMDNRAAAHLSSDRLMIDNFIYVDFKNSEHKLYKMPGRIRMLHYWATWCGPCIDELPALNEFQAKFSKDDFNVVAISVDTRPMQKVEAFVNRLELNNLSFYIDPRMRSMRALRLIAIPVSIFIDRNGYEITRINGPVNWNNPETYNNVVRMLEEPQVQ